MGHTEELAYIFENGNYGTDEDYLVRRRFVRMIANFVISSNPTPSDDPLLQNVQWVPNSEFRNNIYQLDISEDLKIITNPHQNISKFWTQLFENRGKPPFSTY